MTRPNTTIRSRGTAPDRSPSTEAGFGNPTLVTVSVRRPHPTADTRVQDHLGTCPDSQLLCGVVPEHEGFRPRSLQKLLRDPTSALVGTGAPPPTRELRVIRAHQNSVSCSHRDRVRVLARIVVHHTHRDWLPHSYSGRAPDESRIGLLRPMRVHTRSKL